MSLGFLMYLVNRTVHKIQYTVYLDKNKKGATEQQTCKNGTSVNINVHLFYKENKSSVTNEVFFLFFC